MLIARAGSEVEPGPIQSISPIYGASIRSEAMMKGATELLQAPGREKTGYTARVCTRSKILRTDSGKDGWWGERREVNATEM
jgi:hypothetical protein